MDITLKQAAALVQLKALEISNRPDMEDSEWSAGATHWRLTLSRNKPRRSLTVYWSQGSAFGHKPPDAVAVLESLLLDISSADIGFEEWCGEFGYDTDSRKAERTYKACEKIARQWKKFWDGAEVVEDKEEEAA